MSEEDKMTRDEIINMPAGRELDALVAEKVMSDNTRHFIWKRYGKPDAIQSPEYGGPQEYSTDIDAAWQVVEKLEIMGIRLIIWTGVNDIHWYQIGEQDVVGEIHATTLPVAICRAALLAVMDAE